MSTLSFRIILAAYLAKPSGEGGPLTGKEGHLQTASACTAHTGQWGNSYLCGLLILEAEQGPGGRTYPSCLQPYFPLGEKGTAAFLPAKPARGHITH